MNRVTRWLSLLLTEIILKTHSGPLAVALHTVFRFRRRVVDTSRGRFSIDPFSHFGYFILRDGDYEPDFLALLDSNIQDGWVVVDLGAHDGYFSVVAAQLVGDHGRVIAVEPQSRVLPILRENLSLNDLANVSVVPAAVGNSESSGMLHLSPGYNPGGSSFTRMSRFKWRTETVVLRPLEVILSEQGVDRVDLLKLDIEGHEYEAILGSPQVFRQQRVGTVVLELHAEQTRRRGLDPQKVEAFLGECGYTLDRADSLNLGQPFATMVFRA